ncbi:unnamed protein product [Lampetra planeri]
MRSDPPSSIIIIRPPRSSPTPTARPNLSTTSSTQHRGAAASRRRVSSRRDSVSPRPRSRPPRSSPRAPGAAHTKWRGAEPGAKPRSVPRLLPSPCARRRDATVHGAHVEALPWRRDRGGGARGAEIPEESDGQGGKQRHKMADGERTRDRDERRRHGNRHSRGTRMFPPPTRTRIFTPARTEPGCFRPAPDLKKKKNPGGCRPLLRQKARMEVVAVCTLSYYELPKCSSGPRMLAHLRCRARAAAVDVTASAPPVLASMGNPAAPRDVERWATPVSSSCG